MARNKIIQVISYVYLITKNCLGSTKVQNLIRGLSALKGLSLDLFEFICDMKKSVEINSKKRMNRSTLEVNSVDNVDNSVSSWIRELWFPPRFMDEDSERISIVFNSA